MLGLEGVPAFQSPSNTSSRNPRSGAELDSESADTTMPASRLLVNEFLDQLTLLTGLGRLEARVGLQVLGVHEGGRRVVPDLGAGQREEGDGVDLPSQTGVL